MWKGHIIEQFLISRNYSGADMIKHLFLTIPWSWTTKVNFLEASSFLCAWCFISITILLQIISEASFLPGCCLWTPILDNYPRASGWLTSALSNFLLQCNCLFMWLSSPLDSQSLRKFTGLGGLPFVSGLNITDLLNKFNSVIHIVKCIYLKYTIS